MYANLSPRRNVFICSQPLANLPELVLSAIICRIDSCWADVSADIARAAVLASALAAPKTESKRAQSRAAASRARGVRGGRGRGGGAHAIVAGCRAARPALQRGAHLRGDGFCACSAASEPVSSKWARCSAMRIIKRNACNMNSTVGILYSRCSGADIQSKTKQHTTAMHVECRDQYSTQRLPICNTAAPNIQHSDSSAAARNQQAYLLKTNKQTYLLRGGRPFCLGKGLGNHMRSMY